MLTHLHINPINNDDTPQLAPKFTPYLTFDFLLDHFLAVLQPIIPFFSLLHKTNLYIPSSLP